MRTADLPTVCVSVATTRYQYRWTGGGGGNWSSSEQVEQVSSDHYQMSAINLPFIFLKCTINWKTLKIAKWWNRSIQEIIMWFLHNIFWSIRIHCMTINLLLCHRSKCQNCNPWRVKSTINKYVSDKNLQMSIDFVWDFCIMYKILIVLFWLDVYQCLYFLLCFHFQYVANLFICG